MQDLRSRCGCHGGDNAPQETVKGAVDAVNTRKDIKVILTGRQELVEGELSKYTYPKDLD